jgi:hypothetical protein
MVKCGWREELTGALAPDGKWIKIEIRIKRKKDLRELTGSSRLTHPALP